MAEEKKAGDISSKSGTITPKNKEEARKENKDVLKVKTDWVILEFTESWGSKVKGDKEKYHISTARSLVDKAKVAKVIEEVEKYVPKKVQE